MVAFANVSFYFYYKIPEITARLFWFVPSVTALGELAERG